MKQDTKNTLYVAAAAAGLLALLRYKSKQAGTAGIGAVKQPRRIWVEVEAAQREGIDLTAKSYDDLVTGSQEDLFVLARRFGYKGNKKAQQHLEPLAKGYFNTLRRAYKSIAGTNLPYDESVVRNENGDMILTYRDYHLDQLPEKAAEWIRTNYVRPVGDAIDAWWYTLADIATGRVKFVWKGDKIHRGVEQMVFGRPAPQERKERRSYLTTAKNGGQYVDEYAHHLWQSVFDGADDQVITNGVIEAILNCSSVQWARDYIVQQYLQANQVEEPLLYQDVPF